jgi:hypothetical protein
MEDTTYLCSLFDLAEACQQHLAEATRKNCPSRRYSIILEELRLEARRQTGSYLYPDTPANTSQEPVATAFQNQDSMVQRSMNLVSPQHHASPNPSSVNNPNGLQPPGQMEASFDFSDDFGLLDNIEGLNWWTQLDSWVRLCLLYTSISLWYAC